MTSELLLWGDDSGRVGFARSTSSTKSFQKTFIVILSVDFSKWTIEILWFSFGQVSFPVNLFGADFQNDNAAMATELFLLQRQDS